LVRSVMVSVAAQKSGGELVQPIGNASGNATKAACPGGMGKATPSKGMWRGARKIR